MFLSNDTPIDQQQTLQQQLIKINQEIALITAYQQQTQAHLLNAKGRKSILKGEKLTVENQLRNQSSTNQTNVTNTEPKRAVGRPRKDPSQLSPGTLRVYKSYENQRNYVPINTNKNMKEWILQHGINNPEQYVATITSQLLSPNLTNDEKVTVYLNAIKKIDQQLNVGVRFFLDTYPTKTDNQLWHGHDYRIKMQTIKNQINTTLENTNDIIEIEPNPITPGKD